MTAFAKFDRKTSFLTQAREAARRAEASKGQPDEHTWLGLADSWGFLARLESDPCFCGRPSIGYKIFPNGEKRAACGRHLTELNVESILRRIGCKKPQ